MKIKNYWVINATIIQNYKPEPLIERVVKAKSLTKAIDEFYKVENCWFLKNGYKVLSVKPLEVEE